MTELPRCSGAGQSDDPVKSTSCSEGLNVKVLTSFEKGICEAESETASEQKNNDEDGSLEDPVTAKLVGLFDDESPFANPDVGLGVVVEFELPKNDEKTANAKISRNPAQAERTKTDGLTELERLREVGRTVCSDEADF